MKSSDRRQLARRRIELGEQRPQRPRAPARRPGSRSWTPSISGCSCSSRCRRSGEIVCQVLQRRRQLARRRPQLGDQRVRVVGEARQAVERRARLVLERRQREERRLELLVARRRRREHRVACSGSASAAGRRARVSAPKTTPVLAIRRETAPCWRLRMSTIVAVSSANGAEVAERVVEVLPVPGDRLRLRPASSPGRRRASGGRTRAGSRRARPCPTPASRAACRPRGSAWPTRGPGVSST